MTALQAVLFDLGDTLVDLGEGRGDYEARLAVRGAHVYDALAALGAPVTNREGFAAALAHDSEALYHAATAAQRGIDIYEVMRWFLPRHGVTADEVWIQAAGEAFYAGTVTGPGLRPGAHELLDTLRGLGVRLGVISNTLAPRPFMDRSLVRRGLMEFFPVRIYSSEAGVAKPHPAIFRAALHALGVAPECAAYVGDRLHADVAGAQAVGMKGILIEVAHRAVQHPAIAPDARIGELADLLEVVQGWMA
jgi:putative hydrolase of the HAD superfamily